MNRTEHLDWAKQRANEYLDMGFISLAWQSLCADLMKHNELINHPGLAIGMQKLNLGHLKTESAMRKFINDFS
ncbi:MAG: hypothetical protein RMY64_19435 [Nostoc sp. DedQUE08]|uniref:hypothetical protein n=1 Tax=unclassified Nostoc TaxID=2593658 RepID=UPI002AD418C8|nr:MULTISPECIES: hypothetical protein [unclassified Nostoc]MDZ8067765.1 hypothetical protein [Nostoc sp. DedQUE08]MDZ8095935.1 hypothetical protein [Nostoc sp. DedQUE05]